MSDQNRIEQLFEELVQLESPAERIQFLEQLHSEKPEVKHGLEQLFDAYEQSENFLASPMMATTQTTSTEEKTGDQIGPYRLLNQIGEGGMGTVYLAERKEPVRQRVALKIIKFGLDSRKFIARFEAERQALAMMDHPNIAKVLDAGCTERGRPYFVMELVKGEPITQFCDENRFNLRERLNLFHDVCLAVHHAHQKGIIHRDIKPSNVMVAIYDQKPVPKVIDFGVAKATNQQLTEKTLFTEVGSIIGTWEYMSPEQAVLNRLDVDTRTDVYSLGVLLYELLTGETPLDRSTLREAPLVETLRMIREDDPQKPSTRLSSLGENVSATAASRGTKADSLRSELRGDLDWITMKALSKERGRRYNSALDLAKDVDRYLHKDMVEARPPSFGYQLSKLYQKHRSVFLTVLGLFVMLSAGLAILISLYVREIRVVAQRDAIIDELGDRLFVDTLESILGGEFGAAGETLGRFRTLSSGKTDRRVRLCNALIKSFGNDVQRSEANADLLRLNRESDDLITKSLLLASYIGIGSEWEYFATVGNLKGDRPESFEEFLFRGYAYSWAMPDLAVQDLRIAVQKRPSSGIARVLLADALHRKSLNIPDGEEAIELAESAIKQIELATAILPSAETNPLALIAQLDVHTGMLELSGLHEDGMNSAQAKECAQLIEDRLEESLKHPYDWRIHRAQLDSLWILQKRNAGERTATFRATILSLPGRQDPPTAIIVKLIQGFYQVKDLETCTDLIKKYGAKISGYNDISFLPAIEFAVQNGGEEQLKDFRNDCKVRARNRTGLFASLGAVGDWQLLSILGERELASGYAKRLLEFCQIQARSLPPAKQLIPVARRLAGASPLSDAQILSELKTNETRVNAFYWLGMDHLARGERETAKNLFAQAAACGKYRLYAHRWAQLFNERLENDPQWLPWIR